MCLFLGNLLSVEWGVLEVQAKLTLGEVFENMNQIYSKTKSTEWHQNMSH